MIGLVAGCKAGTGIVLIARIVGFDIFYDESRLVRIGRDTILIVLDAEADGRSRPMPPAISFTGKSAEASSYR